MGNEGHRTQICEVAELANGGPLLSTDRASEASSKIHLETPEPRICCTRKLRKWRDNNQQHTANRSKMISAAQMHMSSWKLNTVNSGVQQYQNAVIEIFHPLHLVATGNPTQFDIYIYCISWKLKLNLGPKNSKGKNKWRTHAAIQKEKGSMRWYDNLRAEVNCSSSMYCKLLPVRAQPLSEAQVKWSWASVDGRIWGPCGYDMNSSSRQWTRQQGELNKIN